MGAASNPDLFTAIHAAIEKLEKQAIKVRGQVAGHQAQQRAKPSLEPAAGRAEPSPRRARMGARRIYRVDNNQTPQADDGGRS